MESRAIKGKAMATKDTSRTAMYDAQHCTANYDLINQLAI